MIDLKTYLKLKENNHFYNTYNGSEEDKNNIVEYNKELLKKYSWLSPYSVWTGYLDNDYDYSYTWLDEMPEGWRLAFGMEMCEEIQQALLKAQEEDPDGGYEECWITTNYDSDKILPYVEGFRVTCIKEKYGQLRFYCGSAPQLVHDVIDKYEKLSWDYCINCGQPSKWETISWISPYCDDCKNKLEAEDFYDKFKPIKR